MTLRVSGEFDRGSAWSLRELLQEEKAPIFALDFSLVREFSDIAVAVLARALTELTRPCVLRGLRQHQLRIFRYCGVKVDEETSITGEAARSTEAAHHHR
ncbi:STAS domain-containing protein [Anaeromyxobacter paludicola]|uniref:STAS domain-containing protein n=1 Tax=Anaeromyxobacter paludicola TaxID=2918171 RepID=UPI0020C0EFC5|nr:STAS domain-containing protein [Anaeromyxobacter paludicola]